MAEVAGPSFIDLSDTRQLIEHSQNTMETHEPEKKKPRLENKENIPIFKLEDRLNGILCCAVCLDLPNVAVYQVHPPTSVKFSTKKISRMLKHPL